MAFASRTARLAGSQTANYAHPCVSYERGVNGKHNSFLSLLSESLPFGRRPKSPELEQSLPLQGVLLRFCCGTFSDCPI